MRRRARKDANHADIVRVFRDHGATVLDVSTVPNLGCDLIVGMYKVTRPVEVKDGSKPPSQRKLTGSEEDLIAGWKGGPVEVVCSEADVDRVLERMMQSAVWESNGRRAEGG